MKKLLYIAFNDSSNQLFGVRAKILSQCRAFAEYGYQVDLIERRQGSTVVSTNCDEPHIVRNHQVKIHNRYVRSILDKQNQIADIKSYIQGKQYDACYIRYDFSDPGFLSLLKKLRKVCNRIALELPTYPYDAENQAMLLSRIKLSLDKICRRELHRFIDFIVTFYAGSDRIFGIPVQVIPNGFDFSTMSMVQRELPSDALHIIAVSSMREWHGYERFLEGMHSYYEQGGSENIVLHLVGSGREYRKYQTLTIQYGLGSHVILEGAMHGEKLDALYEISALGVDSLARHRSGIDVLSSLKSREYGAKGIPIINSCKIDIIADDFPYLLRVPADETPIDIPSVLDFYRRCYGSANSRMEVCEAIRTYIEEKCSMKETLKSVVIRFRALDER